MRVILAGFAGLAWMACSALVVGGTERPLLRSLPKPGLVLHVSPTGKDDNLGSLERPFASLERARDEIRLRKQEGTLASGGVQVLVHRGEYAVRQTFRLTEQDSGTAEAPIAYRAVPSERPRFTGGARLGAPRRVTDEVVLRRLPEHVREAVVEWDLKAAGVTELIPFELGGFSSGRGFRTHPAMELFVDDQPMKLARWPNEGFVKTAEVLGPLTLKAWDKKPGTREGRFTYEDDRPRRWVEESEAWLYGYWFWDWADSYEKIARIDGEQRVITLAQPWHRYGYRKQQRYYALNLLCELDAPGEWYLDRETGRLFLNPSKDLNGARVELSVASFPLVQMDNVSHVRFEGLLWELGGADGIRVHGGEACMLVGCTVRKLAGNGIEIRGGHPHAWPRRDGRCRGGPEDTYPSGACSGELPHSPSLAN
jgi:hypothetical protein